MSHPHTPEPWRTGTGVSADMVYAAPGAALALCEPRRLAGQPPISGEANAARIVACVNACAGIKDPAVGLKTAKAALKSVMGYLREYCREDRRFAEDEESAPLTNAAQHEHEECLAALRALGG